MLPGIPIILISSATEMPGEMASLVDGFIRKELSPGFARWASFLPRLRRWLFTALAFAFAWIDFSSGLPEQRARRGFGIAESGTSKALTTRSTSLRAGYGHEGTRRDSRENALHLHLRCQLPRVPLLPSRVLRQRSE
jgi:hypothetical protein